MSKIPKDMQEKNKFQEMFEDNPELKQVFFFAFYIIFFIFIVVLLRSAYSTTNNKLTRYNSGYGSSFKLTDLKKENYKYTYKLNKNGNLVIYDGEKTSDKETFLVSGNPSLSYYRNKNDYYLRNNNTLIYEKCNNPMEFSNIVDISNIERLFINGTYISKTAYLNDDASDYNYEVSTNTILKVVDGVTTDEDLLTNTISARINSNNKLYEIDFDLTNYYKYFDKSINEYKLSLKISKVGDIEISDINID